MLSGTNPKARRRAARQASRFAIKAAARAARQAARASKRAERRQTKRQTRAALEAVSDAVSTAKAARKRARFISKQSFLDSPEGKVAIALAIGQQAERKATRVEDAEEKGGGLYRIPYMDRRIPVIARSRKEAERKASEKIQLEGIENIDAAQKKVEREFKLANRKEDVESFLRSAERANRRVDRPVKDDWTSGDTEALLTILSIAGPSALFGVGGKALQALRASRAARAAGTANNLSTAEKVGATALRGVAGSKSVRAAQRVATSPAARTAAKAAPKATGAATSARRASRVGGALKASRVGRTASRSRALARTGRAKAALPLRAGAAATGRGLTRGAVRVAKSPVGRGAAVVARTAPARTAGRVARPVAGVSARAVGTAARHPVLTATGAPAVASLPASVTQGSVEPFKNALESGAGPVASLGNTIGDALASAVPSETAKNLVRDVFDLPAQVLPSVYLPLAAGFEAYKGDDTRLTQLIQAYEETGLLPAVLRGDPAAVLNAFKEHPLYAGLEVSGGLAVVGRGAGAVGRAAKIDAASTARAPLRLYDTENALAIPRRYSPDLIRKGFQVLNEKRLATKRDAPDLATPAEIKRALTGSRLGVGLGNARIIDREVAGLHRVNRDQRDLVALQVTQLAPGGRILKNPAQRNSISFATQLIAREPHSFRTDLESYRASILAESKNMTRGERAAANETLGLIEDALKLSDKQIKEVFDASRAYAELQRPIVEELVKRGIFDKDQADKAALIPFAITHMEAKYGKPKGGGDPQLLDRDGNPLPLEAIQAEIGRQRLTPPGFVTHNLSLKNARSAWYRAFWPDRATSAGQKARTGASVRKGSFDSSFDALVQQVVGSATMLGQARGFDALLQRFGVRPEGRFFKDFDEATRAAEDPVAFGLPERYAELDMVPARITPLMSKKRNIEGARNQYSTGAEQVASDVSDGLLGDLLNGAFTPAEGEIVLIPRVVRDRLAEHFKPSSVVDKTMQALTGAFKGTVLPTSPTWIMGNGFDVNMRSLFNGNILLPGMAQARIGGRAVTDAGLGRELFSRLQQMDPDAAAAFQARVLGGTHLTTQRALAPYRDAGQFTGTGMERTGALAHALRQTPGPKQVANAWAAYRDNVFALNQRFLEDPHIYAVIGREARRQLQDQTNSWHQALLVGDKAMDDLARGMRGTNNQIRYAQAVEDTLGRWQVNGPGVRRVLMGYAPFWMWTRAATRFVGVTLPARHPIKTGLLAIAANMTQEERMKLGLSYGVEDQVPDFLAGSIPLGDGSMIRTQSYTSFGVFSDYPNTLAQTFLPQFPGIATLAGIDWKGDEIRTLDGKKLGPVARAGLAIYLQGEAMIPVLGLARRTLEGGGSSAQTSTIFNPQVTSGEPGSIWQGLQHVFRPIKTYDKSTIAFLRSLARGRNIFVPDEEPREDSRYSLPDLPTSSGGVGSSYGGAGSIGSSYSGSGVGATYGGG